jgi:hypothetical protein
LHFFVAFVPLGFAQTQAQQAAPIPSPITTAKKVFIANAGADALIAAADREAGDRYYHCSTPR